VRTHPPSLSARAAAISAGRGSAIAFVSQWEDHVSIDAVVVNPQYLELGEAAEAVLLADIAQRARAAGVADVRLHPAYQADGAAFYERCGFVAAAGGAEGAPLRFASGSEAPEVAAAEPAAAAEAVAAEPAAATGPAGAEAGAAREGAAEKQGSTDSTSDPRA